MGHTRRYGSQEYERVEGGPLPPERLAQIWATLPEAERLGFYHSLEETVADAMMAACAKRAAQQKESEPMTTPATTARGVDLAAVVRKIQEMYQGAPAAVQDVLAFVLKLLGFDPNSPADAAKLAKAASVPLDRAAFQRILQQVQTHRDAFEARGDVTSAGTLSQAIGLLQSVASAGAAETAATGKVAKRAQPRDFIQQRADEAEAEARRQYKAFFGRDKR